MTRIQEFTDTLNDENKLTALANKANRRRRKAGLSEISVDVIRTEYTLAKAVEEAKAENNLEGFTIRMKDLIAHQTQYGL